MSMTELTLDQFRSPIHSDSPAGANLEYDPRFVEMQRLAEGTREQQYGDTIVPAQPPDWRGISELASQLCQDTRDLRLAVAVIESQTFLDGLDGLANGFDLLQRWVCDLWQEVHPQLDDDDNGDPFVRINSLSRLCEPDRLPALIGKIALVEAPPHITVHVEDALWAFGETQLPSRAERPTPPEIEAAFLSLSLAELRHRYETSQHAESSLIETLRFLEEVAGPGVWDASVLINLLASCSDVLKTQLRARLSASDSVVAEVADATARRVGKDASSWEAEQVDRSVASLGKIRIESREQAAEVLESAVQYFERFEPSSPIPLLLRRAKRLINQDFVDILRDLAPDALIQAQNLAGETKQ